MIIGILGMGCEFYGFPFNSKNNRVKLNFCNHTKKTKKVQFTEEKKNVDEEMLCLKLLRGHELLECSDTKYYKFMDNSTNLWNLFSGL